MKYPIMQWDEEAVENDAYFREALSELLYARKWGRVADSLADNNLEGLLNILIEGIRRMP